MTEAAELLPVCGAPGCGVVARPEQALCDTHAVEQRIIAADRKIKEASPMAADVLIDLALNAQHEDVRRRASEGILDRAGIRPGLEIGVSATTAAGLSPADVLRERLATMRARLTAPTVDRRGEETRSSDD
jgi:hypothetical protein